MISYSLMEFLNNPKIKQNGFSSHESYEINFQKIKFSVIY